MLSITINGTVIDTYLSKYNVEIQEVYNESGSFTAIDNTQHKAYLGDKRVLSVDFEPMSTEQINELFSAIKANREAITISYIDPQLGENTLTFTCSKLPAASYFESDDGIQFWQIPTVTFEEITAFSQSGGSG